MAITKTSTTTLVTEQTASVSEIKSSVTADSSITKAETQISTAQEIEVDVAARINPTPKEGLGKDTRLPTYDKKTLTTAQQTIQSAISIQRAQTAAQAIAIPISTTDTPANKVAPILAQKAAIPSNKTNADITRAIQKNQRTCNHKYSLITKKCNFCGKNRDSHVYDV